MLVAEAAATAPAAELVLDPEEEEDRSHFGVRKPVILFPFHPAVLKPDFNLSLGKNQGVGDLDAPPPS